MKLPFVTPVAGVSFHPDAVACCRVGDRLVVSHDPANRYDACAVAVHDDHGVALGHLPAAVAARVVEHFGHNCRFGAQVAEIVGGRDGHNTGLRIRLTAQLAAEAAAVPEGEQGVARIVTTRSGRTLGDYVGSDGDDVLVATGSGNTRYPAALVDVTASA